MHRQRITSIALCSAALFLILSADSALTHDGEDHVTLAGIPLEGNVLNIVGVVFLLVGACWLVARRATTAHAADLDAPTDDRAPLRPRDDPTG